MAAKKDSPAFDFIVELLKKNKKATYQEIKAAADKKGLTIYPINFGRAKAMLGLVPSAKRGQGKAAKKVKSAAPKAATPKAAKKRPGRKAAAPSAPAAGAGLEAIISHVKANEAEREKYRRAIEKIRAILDELA